MTASRQKQKLQKERNRKKAEYQQNKETSYTRHNYSIQHVQKFRQKVKIDFITPKEKKRLQKNSKENKINNSKEHN